MQFHQSAAIIRKLDLLQIHFWGVGHGDRPSANQKRPEILMFDGAHTHMLHGAGIFTYIWAIFGANVGKYTMHGACGISTVDIMYIYT